MSWWRNILSGLLGFVLGLSLVIWVFLPFRRWLPKPDRPVEVHSVVVKEIEALGRMELIRYRMQDMVDYEVIQDWWPDPKVLLFVQAEAVGCVDFAQIDSLSIRQSAQGLEVTLPPPEICHVRIDHDSSRVYDTYFAIFQEAELVEQAFRAAEREMERKAIESSLLADCRLQAEALLVPLIKSLSGQEVEVTILWQDAQILQPDLD